MKKIKLLIAGLLCAMLCLSMAACGTTQSSTASSNSQVSATDAEKPLTELETMVQEDLFQEQVAALSESYEAKGMRLEVTAEGDSVVYKCIFTVDVSQTNSKEELVEHLESKAFKTSIDSVLRSFKAQVPQTRSVIVRYIDMNGNTIASKEYK